MGLSYESSNLQMGRDSSVKSRPLQTIKELASLENTVMLSGSHNMIQNNSLFSTSQILPGDERAR